MTRKRSSLLTEPPIPPEEGVRLIAGDLERGRRFGKAVLQFVVYRAESTRAFAEALLEATLRDRGFRIQRVRLPLLEEPDWPYWLHFHPPEGDTVFFVYDLRKAFPEALQYLNYRREIFVEERVRAVFWVLEEEARRLALEAPDFWAFRTQVLEFLEVPPPTRRVEIARELAWWGWHSVPHAYESPEAIDERITMRERLLKDLPQEALAARGELHFTLAALYSFKGSHDQALSNIQLSLELAQRIGNRRLETWAHNGLGNVYFELGRHDDAIAEYKKAIELNPKYAAPHNGLGVVYAKLGRHDEAIAEFKRAIELDQKFAYPYSDLADVHYLRGEYERAAELYQKSAELQPRTKPFVRLAGVMRHLNRMEESARFAEQARQHLSLDDHYNWACLEAICGNTGEALEHLKLALEKEPGLREWAKRDLDLEWIRGDERFWEVVAGADDEGRR